MRGFTAKIRRVLIFGRIYRSKNADKFAQENAENYEHLLKRFDDEGLGQSAEYKTSEGVSQKNNFRELLTHVLFHSMNHRGQVNAAIRVDGFAPPETDYIIYLRMTN